MGLINKIRTVLYQSAKSLGDANAVLKNKVGQRVKNRIIGKISGKIIKKL